jgi:hypothetical protein
MTGDFLNGLGIHPQHDAIGNESFAGGVVGNQFILGLRMSPGFPT